MKYRLVLLDDADQEIGYATAIALRPGSLLVVMPPPGEILPSQARENIAMRLQEQMPGQAISVFAVHAEFVRLEQVSE